MPSAILTTIGTGELLAHLRGDLRKAKRSLWIICPWIDSHFAAEVAKVTASSLSVRLAVRPKDAVDERAWSGIVVGVECLRRHFAALEVIGLERLHAKAIVIDERVAYLGSANFYRYSLEQSLELVVRGPANQFGNLVQRLSDFFEQGRSLKVDGKFVRTTSDGIEEEIPDPIVQKILNENPKAWIIRGKPRKGPHGGR